ncbi:MAG: tetratricopeptide repeat protein [Microthrixaceae bacterium]
MQETDEATRALQLADEAFGRLDREAIVTHLSAAVRGFTAAGEPLPAAMACVRLGDAMANLLGNLTASRAWFARATRLVDQEPPCVEQGWVAVAAMGCDVDDPVVLLERAELALERARRFGDLNLETKALADGGLALVQVGQVAEGMAMLDEAMALACGPADASNLTRKAVCSFFTACYFAADFGRASTWADLLRKQGLIGVGSPARLFLSSHCDSVHATLLMEMGRWTEAEAVLVKAIDEFESAMGVPAWHPAIALADLRTRQGRFADAEALLLGKDQSMQALLPATRLHLERGDHDLAVAAAQRGLRSMGTDRLRTVELLTLLIDAHLGRGDHAAAQAACESLRERAQEVAVPTLLARAQAARARLQASMGDTAGAAATLEEALESLDPAALPWLRTTLLVDLARLRDRCGDGAAAQRAAAEARAALRDLDVVLPPGDAALLDALSAGRTGAGPRSLPAVLTRDGGWWSAAHDGTSVRLRDSKGMQYLAALIAVPGGERHALDLVDRVEGLGAHDEPDRRRLGDAGPVIDTDARVAYRHRIEALRGQVEDALAANQWDAAEALQNELDALVAQLAQAFGLGGRDRVAASASERARLNVTRALRTALARLTEALPGPGAALDRSVRTGMYCTYEPADDEVRWIVQS